MLISVIAVQELICFMFDCWWGSVCGFYNLPDINFFLPIFCVCIKETYAICNILCNVCMNVSFLIFVSLNSIWWGWVWRKHQAELGLHSVLLGNISSVPPCSDHTGWPLVIWCSLPKCPLPGLTRGVLLHSINQLCFCRPDTSDSVCALRRKMSGF